MEAIEYFRGARCGVENCPTKLCYERDGHIICKNGHQKDLPLLTQQDDVDRAGSQGKITRLKSERQEKVSRIYKGRRAFELFLQCYQLILWKQCYCLIHDKGFLPELEGVVRDLWALRLQVLEKKHGDLSETDTESRLYSSQSEDQRTDAEPAKEKGRKEKELPTLIDTLGLCYLGAMLLRIPISLGSLHRWAVVEEVPYILSLRHIPRDMSSRLPVYYKNVFDTRTPLDPDNLHVGVFQLAALYQKKFGLEVPALNYPAVLFGFIQQLALPLETYTAVYQIASMLTCKFNFLAPRFRQLVSALPEIQLLSMLVVSVKLYHPFDSVERYTRSLTEMGCLTIDWDVWNKIHETYAAKIQGKKPFVDGSEVHVNEHDVFNLSNQQIDAYLDWYEKTWIDPESKEHQTRYISQELLDMFPTGRADGIGPVPPVDQKAGAKWEQDTLVEKLIAVQKSLKTRSVISKAREGKQQEPVNRIGSSYQAYRRVSDLPHQARSFYEAAAKIAGISLSTLVTAVYKLELRLQKLRKEQLRKESTENATDEMINAIEEANLHDMDSDAKQSSLEDGSTGEERHIIV